MLSIQRGFIKRVVLKLHVIGIGLAEEAKQLKKLHKATEKCAADIRKVIAGK